MNNAFLNQFYQNIKFKYFCFDRVIIRGYILPLFFPAGVVRLLRPARIACAKALQAGLWASQNCQTA